MRLPICGFLVAEEMLAKNNTYRAKTAWLRALVYFAFCWLAAFGLGTLDWLASSPMPWLEELNHWPLFCLAVLVSGVICYHVIWRHWTFQFNRDYQPVWATLFGSLWGLSEGLLLLSCWHLIDNIGISHWLNAALCFFLFSGFYATWHPLYWDRYIAPEHDVKEYYLKKVWCVHTPHLTLCLAYLACYQEPWLFLLAMVHTLTGCSNYMYMPGIDKTYQQISQAGKPISLEKYQQFIKETP